MGSTKRAKDKRLSGPGGNAANPLQKVWPGIFLALSLGCAAGFAQLPPVPQKPPGQIEPLPVRTEDPSGWPGVRILAPAEVRQGETLKVILEFAPDDALRSPDGCTATLAGRRARLFPQADGGMMTLLPISVFQKPGNYPLTFYDAAERPLKRLIIHVRDGRYRTQNVSVSRAVGGLQPLPGELEAIQALKDTVTPVRYWEEPFISPTVDCQNSPFGVKRLHNGVPTGDYHKGVDLRSPAGRPIHATNSGVVRIARMYRLHGGTVGLDHGQGVSSIYIHMSRVAAHPGDLVRKGDVIGYVGSTGFASGPHLHWGMYVNGLPVNPNQWVSGVPRCQ